jgi:hypothetical protein
MHKKGISMSMYTTKRILCMIVYPSVCEKILLDACAHEREAVSTDALWKCVIVSVKVIQGNK